MKHFQPNIKQLHITGKKESINWVVLSFIAGKYDCLTCIIFYQARQNIKK